MFGDAQFFSLPSSILLILFSGGRRSYPVMEYDRDQTMLLSLVWRPSLLAGQMSSLV